MALYHLNRSESWFSLCRLIVTHLLPHLRVSIHLHLTIPVQIAPFGARPKVVQGQTVLDSSGVVQLIEEARDDILSRLKERIQHVFQTNPGGSKVNVAVVSF